jgi:DNA-binding NtrC family response regulator
VHTAFGMEKRQTIVVLDAEPIVRSAVVAILQHDGYEVLPTDDPDAIIQIVKSHRPALVITNVALPGISGHDAMLKIKRHCPDVPVLMMSGLPDVEVIRQWESKDGFSAFPKPFSAHQLQAKVREMIGNDSRR